MTGEHEKTDDEQLSNEREKRWDDEVRRISGPYEPSDETQERRDAEIARDERQADAESRPDDTDGRLTEDA